MSTASQPNLGLQHPVIVMQIWTQRCFCTENKIKCVKLQSCGRRVFFFFLIPPIITTFFLSMRKLRINMSVPTPNSISDDLVSKCIRHRLASPHSAVQRQAGREGRGTNQKGQLIHKSFSPLLGCRTDLMQLSQIGSVCLPLQN